MKFEIGQKVELVDDDGGMAAPLGSIATVFYEDDRYLYVKWGEGANGQGDGGYYFHQFKPAVIPNEQLVFSFMEE